MTTVLSGRYEWSADKAIKNVRKHRVSFEEAKTAFDDTRALVRQDPSYDDRFVLLGMSGRARLLYVVHAEKIVLPSKKMRIRLISARRANRRECYEYSGGEDC